MCSLPLIITVTPPLPFPGPLQLVFSAKCTSDDCYYVRPPPPKESAPTPFHVVAATQEKHQGRRVTSPISKRSSETVTKREGRVRVREHISCYSTMRLCSRPQVTLNRCLHYVWDFKVFHFFPYSHVVYELHFTTLV